MCVCVCLWLKLILDFFHMINFDNSINKKVHCNDLAIKSMDHDAFIIMHEIPRSTNDLLSGHPDQRTISKTIVNKLFINLSVVNSYTTAHRSFTLLLADEYSRSGTKLHVGTINK